MSICLRRSMPIPLFVPLVDRKFPFLICSSARKPDIPPLCFLTNPRKTDSVAAGWSGEFVVGWAPRPAFALLVNIALALGMTIRWRRISDAQGASAVAETMTANGSGLPSIPACIFLGGVTFLSGAACRVWTAAPVEDRNDERLRRRSSAASCEAELCGGPGGRGRRARY